MRRVHIIAPIVVLGTAIVLLRGCGSGGGADRPITAIFTVGRNAEAADIKERLWKQDFMSSRPLFPFFLTLRGGFGAIDPGGYRIPEGVGSWELADLLTHEAPLRWVTIPEGLRKEQVADRLATALKWNDARTKRFLALGQELPTPYDLKEGFYFPDTYLIPTDEDEEKVLKRFINRFNEQFEPFYEPLKAENIKYDTAVKLASIIQREAAGAHDMPLIAGVLWNRLLTDTKLEVDATLQYMRGNTGDGWWAPIDVAIKKEDSPYNTYKYKGLPPGPISNPGLAALDAVLHPAETDCIFYLHAPDRSIHCSVTYEEHLQNIDTYLR